MRRLRKLFSTQPWPYLSIMKLTWGKLILISFLAFLSQLSLGFILVYLKSNNIAISSFQILGLNIVHNVISVLLIILVYQWKPFKTDFLQLKHFNYKNIKQGLYWGLIILFFNLLLGLILIFIYSKLGITAAPQNAAAIIEATAKSNAFIVFLSVVVAAPIAEELIFRGIVFRTFAKQLSIVMALILSGLVFSLIHMDWFFVIQIWAMGFLLGLSYHKTGSIVTPIVAHMVVNGLYFLVWIT